jgi:hypothetical protein
VPDEQSMRNSENGRHGGQDMSRQYLRFGAMIATSTIVMFALTYTNVFVPEHIRFSEERGYMALLMGSAMAVIMLGFMWGMHRDVRINIGIIAGAFVVGIAALFLSRSQALVEDVAYMEGMIPHHSIAILTSERSNIDDVRVRELANEIIEAQRREIAEMNWLVQDIQANGAVTSDEEAEERAVPSFEASP